MLLEPRSLFLMTDDAYENLLHGIKEVSEDVIDEKVFNGEEHRGKTLVRGTRLSFTIRHVPVVSKLSVGALLSKKS
ncbi:hypothetical protein Y032_0034g2812 [Ancylostoma ceylanicum]|uniref:Alpha-ketoglutarate-dependent dioxygenase AlkB-like domain-containing protein n=1 Tax=Ancylostoma ceylanicum TaxID=53326 RepID=A0A016UNR0_9BILA|nr:hypothetical protein Y032_0034g2812 [Ancylostoma ceylanicum]